jgi:hypothetical protein
MNGNGRQVLSASVKQQHKDAVKRLAQQAGITESELIREMIELVSDCTPVWQGLFLKFQRPKFRWGEDESERYLGC